MARAERSYVRVYYIDLQRDYPQVWFDPGGLSTWLRLLVRADQSWPAAPELPAGTRKADLGLLTSCGLVSLNGHGTYLLKGYEAERGRRQAVATKAAGARWKDHESNADTHADAHANASPDAMRTQRERTSERSTKSMPKPNPKPSTESEGSTRRESEIPRAASADATELPWKRPTALSSRS